MLYGEPDLLEKFRNLTLSGSNSKESPTDGEFPRKAVLSPLQAIRFAEELLERRPEGHPDRPRTQNNLGSFLIGRYIQTGDLASLDDAFHYFRAALGLTPSKHPDRYLCYIHLSRVHSQQGTEYFDLQVAVAHLFNAVKEAYGSSRERLSAAVLRLSEIENLLLWKADDGKKLHSTLLDIYKQTIYLSRQVASLSLGIRTRLQRLSDTDALGIMAASHACSLSRFAIMLDVLEDGRTVFWSRALALRSPHGLETLPSEIAVDLSKKLHILEDNSFSAAPEGQPWSNRETEVGRRQAKEVANIIVQARTIPGLDRFSLTPSVSSLVNAVAKGPGPLVILVADTHSCRAIFITNASDTIRCLSLSTLTPARLRSLVEHIQESELQKLGERDLEDIWHYIVKPIIDALGLVDFHRSGTRRRPRLHWCPTGLFTFLPLHAAGLPGRRGQWCTDYLVSSYTPSLHALVRARHAIKPIKKQDIRALLVGQATAPGFESVQCVGEEVKAVVSILSPGLTNEQREDVTKSIPVQVVLDHLRGANVFHLAGHGMQDKESPLESGAYLKDGRLTVARLMQLNLPDAFMAFFNADEAAKAHRRHPDQAIHLAAAALFAGFRSVIAPIW